MKRFAIALATLAVVGLVSVSYAQEKKKGNRPTVGTVIKVEGNKLTLKTMAGKGKEGEEKTVDCEGASVMINNETKALSDLKADDRVALMMSEDGTKATRVVSPPPQGKKKKAE